MADRGLYLEVGKFNAAMREMGEKLADVTTMKQILEFEVGRIIERALALTDSATVASIRKSHAADPWKPWRTYNIDGARRKVNMNWRMPNRIWGQILAQQKAHLQTSLAARGLTKQSWLALANDLGVAISAPEYVRTATVENHQNTENVETKIRQTLGEYGIAISNHAPLLQFTGASQAFFSAVSGRRNYFLKNLSRGVFDDLKSVARKYPGLAVA